MRGTCATCQYWKKPADIVQGGTCQRFPPTPFLGPMDTPTGPVLMVKGLFPPTQSKETCGEHTKVTVMLAD